MDSKEMVGNEFRKNALRTEPTPEGYEKVFDRLNHAPTGAALIVTLIAVKEQLTRLDEIKKYLFYGKESYYLTNASNRYTKKEFVFWSFDKRVEEAKVLASDPKLIRLLHGVIGLNTEGGELIEALLKIPKQGGEIDIVNFMEEIGDVGWYQEVIGDTLGFTTPEANARVIAKLKDRFPGKFTEGNAINRNLNQERETLEGHEL